MPDTTVKHFIVPRFFCWQNPKYPHDIFDTSFLATQLPLTQNILRSLENQTNKNFDLIFRMHEKHFSEPKYEFIFSTLKNSTTLPIKFATRKEIYSLLEKASDDYDYVITSRMDFDDFIYKDAVADTQSKIQNCNSILAYGYCKGYTYVSGELYDHKNSFGGVGHHSILQSLILKSSFAKTIPFVCVTNFAHDKFKIGMEDFLEKNGVAFSESMFQQNTSTNAYIYFRHEYSLLQLRKHGNTQIKTPNRPLLTSANITKKQLEEEFGFYCDVKSIG